MLSGVIGGCADTGPGGARAGFGLGKGNLCEGWRYWAGCGLGGFKAVRGRDGLGVCSHDSLRVRIAGYGGLMGEDGRRGVLAG